MMKYLLTILCIAFLFTSCESDSEDGTNSDDDTQIMETNEEEEVEDSETKVTYEESIKAILDAKCIQCHATMPIRGATFSLTNYGDVTIRDREERIAARATQGTMPPSGSGETALTDEEVALINQWLADGAL